MNTEKYTAPAVVLHWLMAVMIIAMIGLGFYMEDLPKGSDERTWFFALHKSIGLTLALLAVARLSWKLFNKAPALPDFINKRQRVMSMATHHSLYLLMFIQPVSGYISSSFSGYKTKFWGIPLPHWGWKSPPLNEFFSGVHEISAFLLVTLLVLHISGFLYHMWRKEYQIIRRMWF